MELIEKLKSIIPAERIKDSLADRVSYASDAGFYRLIPRVVVQPVSEEEVKSLFRLSFAMAVPMTFRAAGTSLSGQSITDGMLVELSHWKHVQIDEDGRYVRVQPGITGAMVNARLRPWKRKIGPDPASISSAMMGGIVSNNSSGMCCGVARNAYHTIRNLRFILPNGNVYDTARPEDYVRFKEYDAPLYQELALLRDTIHDKLDLQRKIRHKYKTKNTVGYSMNALLDYDHPLDIMAHLMIGAEGTLGFISEIEMETFPDLPYKATSMLFFANIGQACLAVPALRDSGAEAIELMDRASLRSVEHLKGIPSEILSLPGDACSLLIEYHADSEAGLSLCMDSFASVRPRLNLLSEARFTSNALEQAFLWKVRKGMFPSVGAVRASGTTVVLEDIAFPVEFLGPAIIELQSLFARFGYDQAIIFGHAKDGNIHFVITQDFNSGEEIARYDAFIRSLVVLVVDKYDGALKAEHGTGRNMAPFVETEWGGELYGMMKTLKSITDPASLLNPGVIINPDPQAHLTHLKELNTVEGEVDKCMECGFCEHVCPSKDLTMTPRRRIVARRELQRLRLNGAGAEYEKLLHEYQYQALDTCAVDGLCSIECPVGINTGDLVKRLRAENHSVFANKLALFAARNFALLGRGMKVLVNAGNMLNRLFGAGTMDRFSNLVRKLLPAFPHWSPQLRATSVRPVSGAAAGARARVVYLPTCISRNLGASSSGKMDLPAAFREVAGFAGIELVLPAKLNSLCCGQIFSSKGFNPAFEFSANRLVEALWQASVQGRDAVVLDLSSCTYTLLHAERALSAGNARRLSRMRILDTADFLEEYVLNLVELPRLDRKVALHPVCSLKKMGTEGRFNNLAARLATEVFIPLSANCCGMAGDRGFLFPELTRSATAAEREQVLAAGCDHFYSTSKTCEINLAEHTGKTYESIIYLVWDSIQEKKRLESMASPADRM